MYLGFGDLCNRYVLEIIIFKYRVFLKCLNGGL